MKPIPKPVVDQKFLIMFQDSVDPDKDPDWIIGVKLGRRFVWENDNEEPCVFNVILPEQDFDKFKTWSSLCSYDTTWHSVKKFPWFCVRVGMFDSFISMLAKMKEARE
jgi:hypothetical protein